MAFKVRDLMIDVAPGVGGGIFCRPCTPLVTDYCLCTNQVTIDVCKVCTNREISIWCRDCSVISPYIQITPWTVITPTCGFSPDPITVQTTIVQTTPQTPVVNQPGMVASPQNLAELKAQLRQSLAQVEAQEQAMAESMKPQTVEEADMLEQKLTEALDELRQHKEELRRRSST
jgi:hypothetical protein